MENFQISWEAKLRETSDKTEDVVLTSQLVKMSGSAICPGRQEFCLLEISLVNDSVSWLGPQTCHVVYCNNPNFLDRQVWANSADPDQAAPLGAV